MVLSFGRPMQLFKGKVDRFRGLVLYVREGSSIYIQRSYECGCFEFIVVRIFRSRHNHYVFGVYRNPGLSDKIFDCWSTATAMQSLDKRAFLYLLAM